MSHDVTLYGHWTCPFVHRVVWALAERGIGHDHVDVPPSAVRPPDLVLPEEFVAHSPRLDVVDGHLTEVNVTSPTGLRQLCELSGRRPDLDVVRWLEERAGEGIASARPHLGAGS